VDCDSSRLEHLSVRVGEQEPVSASEVACSASKGVEASFWIAIDRATYRTLTEQAHLTPAQYEAWLRRYYKASFLEP
jgi:hypothetical protein